MALSAETIHSLYEKFLACGRRIATDSRRIEAGSIFFALRGESFDGNKFVVGALQVGAAWAVADDPAVLEQATGASLSGRIIVVNNVLEALQRLATHHRYVLDIPILAITGSNGKTTTKELVSRVLARRFAVSVTRGNLNNHIGVPLTLLAMDVSTEFGVVEMGASARGEIALLCRIAQPNYGIITNIGLSHLEGFGGEQGVRQGKGELFDYLAQHGGMAFYRAGDPMLAAMAATREGLHAIPYPEAPDDVKSNLEGDYNRFNIAAALAVGEYFEIPREQAIAAIASYEPDNNRSQVILTDRNRLLADCYNANPSSMRAAIENFARTRDERHPQKTVILGDMLELGEWSAREHAAIVELLAGSGIGEAYLVGENFSRAAHSAPKGFVPAAFPDTAALVSFLKTNPLSGRDILLKGSRGMKLESLFDLL
ncbi:MAG: UDP-N-acetylmuramoyl-tripeptide--D-alanyl-D-alanine ligase [Rikenellaceae bacterium]|jgi:UDP-N-acetylmuramoyl-tripeptide--D-alanyl-D-alanine ligase|nr:UDP-N-acetylmuramoyl-tripeptide--D-alanyl-D-alanine ligase [Rikenellaceae bacterium]